MGCESGYREALKAVVRRISGAGWVCAYSPPGSWYSCGGQRATCQESESSLSNYCVEAGGEIQLPRLGSNYFDWPSQKHINTYFGIGLGTVVEARPSQVGPDQAGVELQSGRQPRAPSS